MPKKQFRNYLLAILSLLFFTQKGVAQSVQSEKHVEVTMRMIGHQILLHSDDSTSRVLPIKKVGERYKIEFGSDFKFSPKNQVMAINQVLKNSDIAKGYYMEVEDVKTKEIVYSYEIRNLNEFTYQKAISLDTFFQVTADVEPNIVPCGTRIYDKSAYAVYISLIEPLDTKSELLGAEFGEKSQSKKRNVMLGLLMGFLVLIVSMYFFLRKKKQVVSNPNLITIGEFQFDKIHSELVMNNQKVELTAKEADLLILLYNSANTTVERDEILKHVWGDEGDYIGRTLDVFISKLRKKLEVDTKVKIVNIRGVGYKLVLDV